MLTSAQKGRYARRNEKIALLALQGISYAKIGGMIGVTKDAVENVIRKSGGIEQLAVTYKDRKIEPLPDNNMVTVSADDLLNMGLREATDKLSRSFIQLALDLNSEELDRANTNQKFKWLQILAPMVRGQIRDQKPMNINFFVGETNAEDLERKLLDYATGQSIKPDVISDRKPKEWKEE